MRRYPRYCQPRGGVWHFYQKVPLWAESVEHRKFIDQTTGIRVEDDRAGRRAAVVANARHDVMKQLWAARLRGEGEAAQANYEYAVSRCLALGHPPVDLMTLAAGPAAPIVDRTQTVKPHVAADEATDRHAAKDEVAAVYGDVKKVTVLISEMAALFRTLKEPDYHGKKDQQQIDKLHAPMGLVAEELKSVVGDLDLSALTDEHAQKFGEYWDKRVTGKLGKQVTQATANVHFASLKGMWKLIIKKRKTWKLNKYLWAELRYNKPKGGTGIEKPRLPFDSAFIRDKLLATAALDGLDPEARDAFYVMVETGLRNKEFLSLRRKRVHLDGTVDPKTFLPIAFVEIRPDGAELKTDNSFRTMPLVGIALDAIKRRLAALDAAGKTGPDELLFPGYWPDRDEWSKKVNRYLSRKKLRGPKQSAYSLRHSLEDRMIKAGLERDMRDFVMGHKRNKNQEYGIGPDLVLQHEWLTKMAFTQPEHMRQAA